MRRMAPPAGGFADTVRAQVSSLNFVMYIPAMVVAAGLRTCDPLRLDSFSGMVFVFRAKPADHVDESGRNKTE